MKKIKYPLILSSIIMLAACSKNEDEKKSIKMTVTADRPFSTEEICEHMESNVINVAPLDTFVLTIHLSSTEPLSQLKLSLHDAGDCHEHERPATEWTMNKVIDIEGTEVTIQDTIIIPIDVEHNNHHLDILALDESGYQSDAEELNVLVSE